MVETVPGFHCGEYDVEDLPAGVVMELPPVYMVRHEAKPVAVMDLLYVEGEVVASLADPGTGEFLETRRLEHETYRVVDDLGFHYGGEWPPEDGFDGLEDDRYHGDYEPEGDYPDEDELRETAWDDVREATQ